MSGQYDCLLPADEQGVAGSLPAIPFYKNKMRLLKIDMFPPFRLSPIIKFQHG